MTDIASHWSEYRAVWHKAAQNVVLAVENIEKHLPFKLLGFDCDNGGEFINRYLIKYFTEDHPRKNTIQFTRSRQYHKNDNAHIEQRNWSHPRQLFHRERIDCYELIDLMNDIYANEFSLLRNHFYPTLKLKERIAINSRTRRIYSPAKTPYERIMKSPHIHEKQKGKLKALHDKLDPIELKERMDQKLRKFWRLLKEHNRTKLTNAAAA